MGCFFKRNMENKLENLKREEVSLISSEDRVTLLSKNFMKVLLLHLFSFFENLLLKKSLEQGKRSRPIKRKELIDCGRIKQLFTGI